jgi:dihydropteroate synthase
MQYTESADRLRSLQRRRPKLGVETTTRMLAHLDDPHEAFDCVQIAGSNGKGSTARMLESTLRSAGRSVGLFTSPKLNDFREQIRVDGRRVSKAAVTRAVERLDPCLDRLRADDDEPTHFEALTAAALDVFAAEDVDVAVLEVGIGGRYDATSAVDPVASAVTSVSLEHTELLGDTVEEIARDKAQVAPADAPLVTGTTGPALGAVRSVTDVVTVGDPGSGPDVVAREHGLVELVECEVSLDAADWAVETRLPLLGRHQATNAGVAATLARQVAGVDETTLATGLRQATWPGRFEIVEREPTVALDGSHNPGAMAAVSDLLARYDYDDLHVVFGAMRDKDHAGMADELPPAATALVTSADADRAASPATLADAFAGHAADVCRVGTVPEATDRALAVAGPDDFVLVVGSLYAVAEARDRWARLVVPKRRSRDADPGAAALSGATFPEAADDAVDRRTLATTLRPAQADRIAERFEAAGGTCLRSTAGAPGSLVATVLSGTVPQFRAVDGGNSYAARQVAAAVDNRPRNPFDTASGTAVMGILNVTPDSFHDGGEYNRLDAAVDRAEEMAANGADIVDIGGESTRPGADPVSVTEEIARVEPVIEAVADLDVPVSVDTRKAPVAEAALAAGADIVNDVSGLSDPEMRFVVADHDAALVLMHSLSAPVDPDRSVTYDDVVEDVLAELSEQVLHAERAGIDRDRIVVDPGCGFGKSAAESLELLDRLGEFRALGCPVMVGHSRKSMFGATGTESGERLPPTVAATAMAAERGADVVRVHDVAENAAAVRTVAAARETR